MSYGDPHPPAGFRLSSLALLSAGSLFLEITLTRFYSTLFYPPFVFAVLSLAVLGLGVGAAFASWRPSLRADEKLQTYILFAGVSSLLITLFSTEVGLFKLKILTVILVAIPYFFIGLALATIFSTHHGASSLLYLVDLAGGGIGAVMAIPILNSIGAVNGMLLSAFLFAAAGILARIHSLKFFPVVSAGLLMVIVVGNMYTDWLRLDMTELPTDKPIKESLEAGARILRTEWDSFARTDLVDPMDDGPNELFIDGAAGSIMPPVENNDYLLGDIGLFPFATSQPSRVFIVGPGGGLDVWFGLRAEAEEIIAVEVNPASVQIVREFAEYNGDLYDQPSVHVLIDDGRSVLRRDQSQYDLIFLSQVVTLAAERSGYALTENTVYTVEAFKEYLAHLSDRGQIALKLYDEATLTRALATALAAFEEDGLEDDEALAHVMAFLDARSNPPVPLLMIRKTPYSFDESLELGAVARRVGFTPLFLPGVKADPPLDAVEAGAMSFDEIVEEADSDISPTNDDKPFFFNFERGLPGQLRTLLIVLSAFVLVGAGWVAYSLRGIKEAMLRWAPIYFAGLGAGFMIIEVAVIQKTRLFLGHPTLAVTTVLSVLLLGGGIGSFLAGRWVNLRKFSIPVWPGLLAALLALIWMALWPSLHDQFLGGSSLQRLSVVVASLLPLALVMGMPFPLGLKAVGQRGTDHVARGWGVNGIMTVVGSTGAVSLAILVGFNRVIFAGVIAYLLAASAAWMGSSR